MVPTNTARNAIRSAVKIKVCTRRAVSVYGVMSPYPVVDRDTAEKYTQSRNVRGSLRTSRYPLRSR